MMEKTFDPAAVEARIAADWEAAGAFRADRPERLGTKTFTVVIPPPNVTGTLHMGHALNNTLQDILCRFERMRGKNVLWQPGVDHAGIATQMVVERRLAAAGEPGRRDLGRDAFLEKVWAWKAESGGAIVNQLRRLGASCDWSRERFTMDPGSSKAVLKAFVELYRAGLIYKDKRLVNWDPKLLTAVSDIEVVSQDVKGSLWHFKYPLVDENGVATDEYIVVATTRPETMLGDTAVAVHPEDERYLHLHGRFVRLPLVGRLIPIVADSYSDPEKGSGAVKITPAHDFNDFEVGSRHKLPLVNILDAEARLLLKENEAFVQGVIENDDLSETLDSLHGLSREEARKAVIAAMESRGLIATIETHQHQVPHGDRSGVVIEPWLTDQWYVDARALAGPALAAVRSGETAFVPKNWEKTFFDWLEKIQPWCISRQLWWGHQNSRVVFALGRGLRRRKRGGGAGRRAGRRSQAGNLQRRRGPGHRWRSRHGRRPADPRRGRARHLVLVGPMADVHARLARGQQRSRGALSDRRPGHRLRHHLFLGRPNDDVRAAFPAQGSVPPSLSSRAGARREGR